MILFSLRYALATLRRYPAYAGLNILGLSLALGCCLLLYWFVRFHYSFEEDQPDQGRIVRVVTELKNTVGGVNYSPGIPLPVGPALRRELPWLAEVAMSIGQGGQLVQVPARPGQPVRKFVEDEGLAFVEPAFFSVLHYHWLLGSPRQSLSKPFSAVLTQRLARRYFGTVNPVGRKLRLNNRYDVTVTGLLADIPLATDRRYELFLSWATVPLVGRDGTPLDSWEGVHWQTYCWVKLRQAADTTRLSRLLPGFRQRHAPTLTAHQYHVLPLAQLHTAERYNAPIGERLLQTLIGIGGLLLLTGIINFINLATAQAGYRAREVGVQRVIGATRGRVFGLFMLETALLVGVAAGAGLVIAYTLLPLLQRWTETPVPLQWDASVGQFAGVLVGALILATGVYPGWVLARFRPARVLKASPTQAATGGLMLRQCLVVGQLAVSMGFVLAVAVMFRQTERWLRTDPGFDAGGRLLIAIKKTPPPALVRLRQALLTVSGVANASFFFQPPAGGTLNTQHIYVDDQSFSSPEQPALMPADARYVPLFGLSLVAGRNIGESDTAQGILLSQSAARVLGFARPELAIGHRLRIPDEGIGAVPVRGILRDWYQRGLKNDPVPVAIYQDTRAYTYCALQTTDRFGPAQERAVRRIWAGYYPQYVFESYWLDDGLAGFYKYERRQLKLIGLAAGIALLIGCVGLYGLVTFLTGQRARELAVRRTLGATTGELVWLVGREFGGMLLVAFAVAAPLTGWLMSRWLAPFAQHIALSVDLFAFSFGLIALVTLLTVGYRTIQAALTNPARALRAD